MDELLKDLNGFSCEACPNNKRLNGMGIRECWEWDGGACVEYALQWVAARLTELGYVKVVRCRECKEYAEWEGLPSKEGWKVCGRFGDEMPPDGYCSEGDLK